MEASRERIKEIQRKDAQKKDNRSDRELLAAFVANRDEEAFRTLVLRHRGVVWSVCHQMLSCHQDREDVFQATFLKLVIYADRAHWHDTIGGWLYKVACHLSHTTRKVHRRRRETEIVDESWSETESLEAIQRQDAELALHDAIGRLPKRTRDVIVLYYFHNYSQHEAAAEIGCSVDAVNGLLRRGRRRLLLSLGRSSISFSFVLVFAQQTLQAAQRVSLSPLIDQTVHLGFAHLVSRGTVPLSPEVSSLCNGGYSSMFHSEIVSKAMVTVGCAGLFCLAGGGLLHGIDRNRPTAAVPILIDRTSDLLEVSVDNLLADEAGFARAFDQRDVIQDGDKGKSTTDEITTLKEENEELRKQLGAVRRNFERGRYGTPFPASPSRSPRDAVKRAPGQAPPVEDAINKAHLMELERELLEAERTNQQFKKAQILLNQQKEEIKKLRQQLDVKQIEDKTQSQPNLFDTARRASSGQTEVEGERRGKVERREKLAELVKEFNKLNDEERYEEAAVIAKRAKLFAPDEPVADQIWQMAKLTRRIPATTQQTTKPSKAFLNDLLLKVRAIEKDVQTLMDSATDE